jgi:uncharacterized membrane protein
MRLASVDWLRGVAVLCMILWHVVDAWTVPARDPLTFTLLGFIGGWAAPLFLLLTGVSISLAGDAQLRKGVDRGAASRRLQKRGWQIFMLAHLFRFQAFLLNINGRWNAILKPDILNILGLGMVFGSIAWRRATTPARAVAWLAAPSIVIVALITPLARGWWWPTLLHPRLEAYIRPVGNFGVFSLFPWIALVLIGVLVGLELSKGERAFRTLTFAGVALIAVGTIGMLMPTPFPTTFWADSISWFVMRLGLMLAMMVAAWWWTRRWPAQPESPLVLLGRTSLFVYWVHVELAYGALSYPLHHALSLPQSLTGYAVLTVLMYFLASLWLHRDRSPLTPAHMRA